MMNKQKSLGFTLIEILFVIAILSVVASIGIATFQQRTSSTKLQKAALQLKALSQAALDAYNDNRVWPVPFNQSKLKPYIPYADTNNDGEYLNPWGNPYTSTTDQPKASEFNITTVVPTQAIADQLKAKLPFASTSQDGSQQQVALSVPLPGAIGTPNYIVVDKGSVKLNNVDNTTYTSPSFSCPRGYQPGIFVGLKGLMSDWGNAGRIWRYNYSMAIYQAGVQTTCGQMPDGKFTCSFYNLLYTDRQTADWYKFTYSYPMNEYDNKWKDHTNEYSYLQYNYTTYCVKPLAQNNTNNQNVFRY